MRRTRTPRRLLGVLAVALAAVAAITAAPAVTAQAAPVDGQVNLDGLAFPDNRVGAPVQGILNAHDHPFSYLGFGQGPFCGKTFDPDGITAAMVDCPEHKPLGIPAWFEQLSSGKLPLTPHDTTGWPTFKDWPRADSPTHNQTYYKGMERAWRAGTRLQVIDAVSNRGLCLLYTTKRAPCDEMTAIRTEIQAAKDLQSYVDAQSGGAGKGWFRIVTSPEQARQVIADGKLAVVLGIETSEPFGCSRTLGAPQCTEADIDRGLDEMTGLGVRSMFVCHKYDNALCGVRYDEGVNGAVVNIGNFLTTGQFWQAQTCTGPRHDNTVAVSDPAALTTLLANATSILKPVTLPIYPAGPHCNPIGLTGLGEYMIKGMIRRGMLVELDHMSAKAADAALKVLEDNHYAGAISSHSWMDTGYNQRLQRLGGMITGITRDHDEFLPEWRATRATADPGAPFGYGYANDMNGLHFDLPRPGADPTITYPFRSFDGAATVSRQVWGQRTWDFGKDGMAQEGLTPDWLESLRIAAGAEGPRFVADMTSGVESYLRTWERAAG
ncbi:hypothetical protein [Pseudonocardia sp. GCM10023141]|uniref:hypothetical protein n=1 Tax=Pseudonocardia sp. GCM10023141 TaxID=3252653 RepID=UPI0036199F6C